MIYSTGKRKSAIAKVWLNEKAGDTTVNDRLFDDYFKVASLRQKVLFPQSVLVTILQKRKSNVVNEEAIAGITSVKGNKIPTSFFDYVNSLSEEISDQLIVAISALNFKVKTVGGGIKGQAESVMYGVAKCIADFRPEAQKILKDLGLLTRDSRIVERKKPGLRKARKKEQYSKR